ncbi:MAG: hypothetical protein ACXW30_05245 [Micavibrio sp.]
MQREAAFREGAASGDLTSYFNGLSLVSSFANANQINNINQIDQEPDVTRQSPTLEGMAVVESDMSGENAGAFARQTNAISGGLVHLTTDSAEDDLAGFTGVGDIESLNVPKAYIEAWRPSIAAHELRHLQDRSLSNESSRHVLIGEIEADHGSLRQYFNQDYNNFVMDMQALRSLNVIASVDDHATHIWTEEYGDGLKPTELEAQNIMSAPQKIYERTVMQTSEAFPETPRADIENALEDTGQRYAAFKALRERGAFNDIPNGNEFVDKYLAASERRYSAEILSNAPVDDLREAYRQGPQMANMAPAQARPAMSMVP